MTNYFERYKWSVLGKCFLKLLIIYKTNEARVLIFIIVVCKFRFCFDQRQIIYAVLECLQKIIFALSWPKSLCQVKIEPDISYFSKFEILLSRTLFSTIFMEDEIHLLGRTLFGYWSDKGSGSKGLEHFKFRVNSPQDLDQHKCIFRWFKSVFAHYLSFFPFLISNFAPLPTPTPPCNIIVT